MTANPDDAAREALLPCPFCGASVDVVSNRDWHRIQGEHAATCPLADFEFATPATDDQLAQAIADWNTRLAALAGSAPVAPWLDFAGQTIHDRDRIRHPDGTTGVVLYLPDMGTGGEAWRVVYSGGDISRLALQVGDKGQAIVIGPHAPAKAREVTALIAAARSVATYQWRNVKAVNEDAMCDCNDRIEALRAALATFAEGEE